MSHHLVYISVLKWLTFLFHFHFLWIISSSSVSARQEMWSFPTRRPTGGMQIEIFSYKSNHLDTNNTNHVIFYHRLSEIWHRQQIRFTLWQAGQPARWHIFTSSNTFFQPDLYFISSPWYPNVLYKNPNICYPGISYSSISTIVTLIPKYNLHLLVFSQSEQVPAIYLELSEVTTNNPWTTLPKVISQSSQPILNQNHPFNHIIWFVTQMCCSSR